jgi:hypothetical protein
MVVPLDPMITKMKCVAVLLVAPLLLIGVAAVTKGWGQAIALGSVVLKTVQLPVPRLKMNGVVRQLKMNGVLLIVIVEGLRALLAVVPLAQTSVLRRLEQNPENLVLRREQLLGEKQMLRLPQPTM